MSTLGKTATLIGIFAPLAVLAEDAGVFNPDDPSSLVGSILDAFRTGNVGLGIVLCLMFVIGLSRKVVAKRLDAVASDLGGTLFAFVFTVLVMLAGPLSAGAALTVGVVKTAVFTAFATSGGWTFVKRAILPMFPWLHGAVFSKIPVVGGIIEWFVKSWASRGEKKTTSQLGLEDESKPVTITFGRTGPDDGPDNGG